MFPAPLQFMQYKTSEINSDEHQSQSILKMKNAAFAVATTEALSITQGVAFCKHTHETTYFYKTW